MPLRRLEVRGLRNLRQVRLEQCGRINILSGANGSGKTSLLEAIYLLGMGRSFRSSRLMPLINHEMDSCTVFGELAGNAAGDQSLGVRRSRQGQLELRVNRESVAGASALAKVMPLQLINADAFALVDGGPKARRQFMDWGAFHVKQDFLEQWRRAQRCLRQRNQLLRGRAHGRHDRISAAEMAAWDKELSLCSEQLDGLRAHYIEDIKPIFLRFLQRLAGLSDLSLDYQRGWDRGQRLEVLLQQGFDKDVRQGYTAAGPHRANLDIRIDGRPAAEVLSRGQQKLVVSSLRLAQGWHLAKSTGTQCVYLIDDLPAELDEAHRAMLCRLLDEMGCQVFITGVDADVIESQWLDQSTVCRFHVEQGQIFSK